MDYSVDVLLPGAGRRQVKFKASFPLHFFLIEEEARKALQRKHKTSEHFAIQKVTCTSSLLFDVPAHAWRSGGFMLTELEAMKHLVPNAVGGLSIAPGSEYAKIFPPFGMPTEIGYRVAKSRWVWVEQECPVANKLIGLVQAVSGQLYWAERRDSRWLDTNTDEEISAVRYALVCCGTLVMRAVWELPKRPL